MTTVPEDYAAAAVHQRSTLPDLPIFPTINPNSSFSVRNGAHVSRAGPSIGWQKVGGSTRRVHDVKIRVAWPARPLRARSASASAAPMFPRLPVDFHGAQPFQISCSATSLTITDSSSTTVTTARSLTEPRQINDVTIGVHHLDPHHRPGDTAHAQKIAQPLFDLRAWVRIPILFTGHDSLVESAQRIRHRSTASEEVVADKK